MRWNAEARTALLFLLPSFIGFLVFYAIPALRGFYLSFTDFDLLKNSGSWVGLDNYQALLQDTLFWNALWITFKYVIINIGIQTVLALGIAVLMHRLTQSVIVRSVVLLPWLVPERRARAAVDVDARPEPRHRQPLAQRDRHRQPGLPRLREPGDPDDRRDQHLEEHGLHRAAAVRRPGDDPARATTRPRRWTARASGGCSARSRSRCCGPVLALVLVVTVIGSFQVFDTIQIATAGIGGGNPGGPGNSSRVLYMYIFQQAFEFNALGYASALAVALILLLVIVAAFQMRMLRAGESDLA